MNCSICSKETARDITWSISLGASKRKLQPGISLSTAQCNDTACSGALMHHHHHDYGNRRYSLCGRSDMFSPKLDQVGKKVIQQLPTTYNSLCCHSEDTLTSLVPICLSITATCIAMTQEVGLHPHITSTLPSRVTLKNIDTWQHFRTVWRVGTPWRKGLQTP